MEAVAVMRKQRPLDPIKQAELQRVLTETLRDLDPTPMETTIPQGAAICVICRSASAKYVWF
jgi:hypothetical protein